MPAVLTRGYLEALAAWTAGEGGAPPVPVQIAFGTGGLRTGPDDPAPPDPSREALEAEILRKPIAGLRRTGERVEVWASLRGEEIGSTGVSECGLLDAQGRLLLYATFRRKELAYGVQVRFRFALGLGGPNG